MVVVCSRGGACCRWHWRLLTWLSVDIVGCVMVRGHGHGGRGRPSWSVFVASTSPGLVCLLTWHCRVVVDVVVVGGRRHLWAVVATGDRGDVAWVGSRHTFTRSGDVGGGRRRG
ncbi:uncharacterized protein LACBIDRAFT_307538 [Laccaria bicolor S238N-H82]|uniref:Predicted protein n=1 Tax=Laccaria bicolor (strain S238N-H82 / ATCC MYA-4686) TaxID=486041 RepID=B0DQD7_LACBS|nr:uncharacterized protein LACBIDRAFT_307538 [Laccaria bicolor S238N-H82]EDR03363.1 predicted protein [Laccaria bicolor S238N-H82]|eukprot:XP_001886159.1 predicted protein [Laccaria bicolor S238N-H82]